MNGMTGRHRMRGSNRIRTLVLGLAALASLAGVLASRPAAAQTTPPPAWRERFLVHDRNGDGRIDRAEFQEWMADACFQRDQGRKGYLTIDDARGSMTPELFRAMNRMGDGKLWLAEFLNAMFLDFQAIDTADEGFITMQQIEVYVRRAP